MYLHVCSYYMDTLVARATHIRSVPLIWWQRWVFKQ